MPGVKGGVLLYDFEVIHILITMVAKDHDGFRGQADHGGLLTVVKRHQQAGDEALPGFGHRGVRPQEIPTGFALLR
jgi:hypothetical protein